MSIVGNTYTCWIMITFISHIMKYNTHTSVKYTTSEDVTFIIVIYNPIAWRNYSTSVHISKDSITWKWSLYFTCIICCHVYLVTLWREKFTFRGSINQTYVWTDKLMAHKNELCFCCLEKSVFTWKPSHCQLQNRMLSIRNYHFTGQRSHYIHQVTTGVDDPTL